MDIQPIIINEKHAGGIENRSALLENGVKRIGIIGGSGSGKTTWITKWYLPCIHEPIGGITVIAKNQEQVQYETIEKYCKKAKIEYSLLEEFTMDDMHAMREDDTPKLLIYDDLANTDNFDALLGVAKYGRVKHIYLAVIGQDYTSVPKEVRQNLNQYAIFPLGAAHAARSMISGLSAYVDQDNLKKAYKWTCKPANKYSMILIQMDGLSIIMNKNDDIWNLANFQSLSLTPRTKGKKGKEKKKKEEEEEEEDEDTD
jgi:hypothetical protein